MDITVSDWKSLTPFLFEDLITELLEHLGFENVQHLGGTGDKGRDITCERNIEFGPGIVRRCHWIVQCKHYYPNPIRKSQLKEDLAAAMEHTCDFWWLMTTANITSDLADWLKSVSRRQYPFGIEYVDRGMLERLLRQAPKIVARYFPKKVNTAELELKAAMDKMAMREYEAAIKILQDSDDGTNPQFSYLLACCFSMIALRSIEENTTRAYCYLSEASERGYLEYLSYRTGWPKMKCLFEIHRDPELQFIKQRDPERFNSIFEEPIGGGGGCFSPHTLVKLPDDGVMPISQIKQGQEVASILSDTNLSSSVVEKVQITMVCHTVMINSELITTFDQPVHTVTGWRKAGDLMLGDIVTTERGPGLVYSIEYIEGTTPVYGLALRSIPYYYTNGYLVHNKIPP